MIEDDEVRPEYMRTMFGYTTLCKIIFSGVMINRGQFLNEF